ncbi:MAG: YitT family protein [Mogibacterium sp.]|nr:YitT family protein [Mogibacterium sp.]
MENKKSKNKIKGKGKASVKAKEAVDPIDRKLEKEAAEAKKANDLYAHDPELHGRTQLQARSQEIGLALLAVVIGSTATVSIMLPNGLTFGGITGIARIIQHYTDWNYSLVYYALAMVVTAIVWAFLGFKEVRKILLMSLAYPAFMLVLEINDVVLIRSDDLFLVSVFTGVVLGVSNGLTFKAGYSSGGTDSLAKVIKYRWLPHLGIIDITFAINAVIVACNAFVFGLQIALYAVIIIYVSMKVGETVMYGFSDKIVELDIIPGDADALTEFIMGELGRGVSSIEVTGEYTGDKRKQLKILCSPRESFLIKRHLAKEDPNSFVSVISVKSVWGRGRGFSDIHNIDS